MNRHKVVLKKRKKKTSPILTLFFILLGIIILTGLFVNIVVFEKISQKSEAGSSTSTEGKLKSIKKSNKKPIDNHVENAKQGKNTEDNEKKTTIAKSWAQEHNFEKINHAVEGAKLKVSNEPGHIQHSILQASYESKLQYLTDNLWVDILAKGAEIMKKNKYAKHLVSIEVGAHRPKQSLDAAKLKFHAYCVEPSPKSFKSIYKTIEEEIDKDPKLGEYIHLINMAAGSETGKLLEFKSAGSTGDHVGNFDMWNMKAGVSDPGLPEQKKGNIVKVPSLKLDDLIYNQGKFDKRLEGVSLGRNQSPIINEVHAIKIDTQGFEPEVFSGLQESIKSNKIKYILFEYWPNGMSLLNNRQDKCEFATQILDNLVSAGYTLYALPVLFHPSIRLKEVHYGVTRWFERPFGDYKADCEYLLNMENKYDLKDYKAGFWTDYFAVAPDAEPIEPTSFGKV